MIGERLVFPTIGLPDDANGDAFPSLSPRECRLSNRLFLNGHADVETRGQAIRIKSFGASAPLT
jgi:hypothetical protein